MLGEYLDAHPLKDMIRRMPVCPFPPMEDRAAWQAIDPADRADLLEQIEELKGVPYPMCTASQFMAFAKTGSRAAYEEPYFLRRRKLVVSVLQLCLEGGGKAIDDVIDGIWCICEESSWVISAHNVNSIPGASSAQEKPLPDVCDPYIDLFAAQTGMILALTDALAGRALDGATPVVRRRIRLEIERRILTPFMTRFDYWWMGFIRKDLCNWTPWIVSNVFIAASLMLRDPLRFAELLDRGCRMLDRWLAVMPQDGGCDEGTAYYNMAGGALLDCLELLERATQGRMALWGEEKIRNILSFPLRTQLPGGWFVNFADCDARPYLSGERIQTAGERLGDAALAALGQAHRGMPRQEIGDVPHFSRLLMRLFHPAGQTGALAEAPRDVWLPDLQLRVVEKGGLILCAKGGHNGESHNHNDVGSFMLVADGEPEVIDLGNMTYTAQTFSPERYTLMNTRSAYHNVPLIGDCEQRPGEAFRAVAVRRLDDGLALDMAGAYGGEAQVLRCERQLELTDALTLREHIALCTARPVTWVFMLRRAPQMTPGCATAGGIRIRFDERLKAETEEIPVRDARMAKNFPGSVWRLTLDAAPAASHDQTFVIERTKSHE